MGRYFFVLVATVVATIGISGAQTTERARPSEWQNLVDGGRFMDRMLPMRGEKTVGVTWGTSSVQGRYVDNGIEKPDVSFWGGNILRDDKGTYHLFVAGWPENSPKGHMFWPYSTVYHATSENMYGPFSVVNTVGKGHNPEAYILDDGRVVVYVYDGYYIADSLSSLQWTYGQFSFDPRGRKIIEGLSNLTFAKRQDGSRLMVCRGGGVWISKDGLSPYRQITCKRVYPDVEGCFEDPVVWRDSIQYHLIVNDWLGRIAFYERSLDGIHWVVEQGEAYVPGIAVHADGISEGWFKYERPKIFQDELGRACQINFAVIDTLKFEDKPDDRHSSKNIAIPLNGGLDMEVLNTEPITERTKKIELAVKTEEELDVETLRLGSYNEVNFGRGCKVIRQRRDGDCLILTFDGKGSGITADEWAPKLIGRTKKGDMVFGYARLPYVDYRPVILSSDRPAVDTVTNIISVKITNFGLKPSERTMVEVESDLGNLGSVVIGPLGPYEEYTFTLQNKFESKPRSWKVTIGENTEEFD